MEDLKKFIATTIREYLNERANILTDYINKKNAGELPPAS